MFLSLLNEVFINFLIWWPWLSIYSDIWVLEWFILYLLYLMYNSNNLYYILLYFLIEIFFLGLFISFYQMELFTGFLWVLEGTIIFILLVLLFYLNEEGRLYKINLNLHKYYYVLTLCVYVLLYSNFYFFNNIESGKLQMLIEIIVWDNFYESLTNININDFNLLFISYYRVNNFEFLIIGFFLLIGSLVCINLNSLQKLFNISNYNQIFQNINYLTDFINFSFLRKQNLSNQNQLNPHLNIFNNN